MLDHLHSTESLEVTHDGCDASRVQKTTAVADWDECQQRLRVCFRRETYDEQTGQLYNCCRCEKCVRTMTTLDALGKLTAFASFPRPLSRDGIRRTSHEKPGSRLFFDDILSLARASGRRDLIFDLRYARLRSLMASAVPPRLRAWLRHIRNWRSDAAPPMYR